MPIIGFKSFFAGKYVQNCIHFASAVVAYDVSRRKFTSWSLGTEPYIALH